jgi:hypothetical protein
MGELVRNIHVTVEWDMAFWLWVKNTDIIIGSITYKNSLKIPKEKSEVGKSKKDKQCNGRKKKDKQCFTNHYIENERLSNTNSTNNRG